MLTDNAPAYRSTDGQATCVEHGIALKKTRPYRPQTHGKVERFHRTLLTEWAYIRRYSSDAARTRACANGSTSTTLTAATPQSAACRPRAASPTWLVSTARGPG